jgi:Fe-S-cluster containining protein
MSILRSCQYARDVAGDGALGAGTFTAWLESMRGALEGVRDADVPCDGCTACCRSSQFVHIAPDETDALAHVPRELQFPAPGLPKGHVVLGYDDRGHCPMLVDDRCSIYEHRPRACRTYDCRVFAAADVEPDGERQVEIAARVRRWRFEEPADADRAAHEAVRAAARASDEGNPVQRAVHAVRAVLEDRATGIR